MDQLSTIRVVIFGIGLNKTGTTTLGDAGEILGFKRLGWVRLRDGHEDGHRQPFGSDGLTRDWLEGRTDHLIEVASGFDLVEDLPWPLVYREMAQAFPDARFVLTRRTSPETWLASIVKHQIGATGVKWGKIITSIYGSPSAAKDPELYVERYNSHLNEVRAFFAGSDRLLEVCWEEGDGWPQLCGFLGVPAPDVPFPPPTRPGRSRHDSGGRGWCEKRGSCGGALGPR